MAYLDLENGKCEGWTIPMYYGDALEFVKELEGKCQKVKENEGNYSGGATLAIEYKYQDGARFLALYNADCELVKLEGKCTNDSWETIYTMPK